MLSLMFFFGTGQYLPVGTRGANCSSGWWEGLQLASSPLRWPWGLWNVDRERVPVKHKISLSPKAVNTQELRLWTLVTLSQTVMTMWGPGVALVFLVLAGVGHSHGHSDFTCEPIKVPRCLNMPYNMTYFPNMMEHYDQDIAASKMEVSPYHLVYFAKLTAPAGIQLSIILSLMYFARYENQFDIPRAVVLTPAPGEPHGVLAFVVTQHLIDQLKPNSGYNNSHWILHMLACQ